MAWVEWAVFALDGWVCALLAASAEGPGVGGGEVVCGAEGTAESGGAPRSRVPVGLARGALCGWQGLKVRLREAASIENGHDTESQGLDGGGDGEGNDNGRVGFPLMGGGGGEPAGDLTSTGRPR